MIFFQNLHQKFFFASLTIMDDILFASLTIMDDILSKPASEHPCRASTDSWTVRRRLWTRRRLPTKFLLPSFLMLSTRFALIKHPAWLSLKYSVFRLIQIIPICNRGRGHWLVTAKRQDSIHYCTASDKMPGLVVE